MIPRIFHRIWLDEEERPQFLEWKQRLQDLHPNWEVKTWSRSDDLPPMRNQELFDRYLPTDPFGRVPDILRYELLWQFGGVYIDTDFEPLRSIEPLLADPRPFAAWENDQTMCTAILAAPPQHPAIDELIEGLPAQCASTEGQTPNFATGPEYATSHWRLRSDVRRLPPWTFYPVGWWERELLGNPANYHPDTYAVHHWSKGWGDKVQQPSTTLRVVVLVAWRSGDEERDAAWEYCQRQWEELGWPVFTGDSDGEWNRSQAINRAAAAAGSWDVAVIADADTMHKTETLKRIVRKSFDDQSVIVPWKLRWKLNQAGSQRLMSRPFKNWTHSSRDLDRDDRTPVRLPVHHRGGTVIVPRRAWERIGGFDEGFVGWGHEDVAFRIAAETLAEGGLREEAGVIYHLHHERDWPSPENDARKELYKEAAGNAPALLRLREQVPVG